MKADILVVDDEADIRGLMKGILEDEGYKTRLAAKDVDAYARVEEKVPDMVILDIWLQNSQDDGLAILKKIKAQHPHLPVVMISGHGNIETAVSAIKIGAYDFIEKPFKTDRLLLMVERALEAAKLKRENESLRQQAEGPAEMIGDSPAMTALKSALQRVAQTNSRVLITGESGSGKNSAARFIHRESQRSDNPFITVNCAGVTAQNLDVELFGSQDRSQDKGGVTGALEQANGGTLLLDEVAEMPSEIQHKIVRVLQDPKIQRAGDGKPVELDIRILATTARNLQSMMEAGKFRQDLYYRLNVVPVDIPPLRDRVQDMAPLARFFVSLYAGSTGVPVCTISENALAIMQTYEWPGNVRQFKNVIEGVMIMHTTASDDSGEPSQNDGKNIIQADDLPPDVRGLHTGDTAGQGADISGYMGLVLRDAREVFERQYLESQIRRFGGNISQTAQFIGMERSALHRKMKQLELTPLAAANSSQTASGSASSKSQQAKEQDNRKKAAGKS